LPRKYLHFSVSGDAIEPKSVLPKVETSIEQPTKVDKEKKSIYEPTISYFKDKCHLDLKEIKVYVLLIGSRGTISRLFANFIRQLGLTSNTLEEIAITAVKG